MKNRLARFLLIVALLLGVVGLLVGPVWRLAFRRELPAVNLLVRDWTQIQFTTVQAPARSAQGKFAIDYTDAGIIEAEGQFLWTGPTGIRFEPAPAEWYKRTSFHIEETPLMVIDTGNLKAKIIPDHQNGNYLTLESPSGDLVFVYTPPFTVVPPELQQGVIYQSDDSVSLSLRPISSEKHEGKAGNPNITFLSEATIYFSLNYRPACEVKLLNEFDASTDLRVLNILERCTEEPTLPPGLLEEPRVSIVPSSSTFATPLVLLPEFYEVNSTEFQMSNTEDHHIFVLGGDALTWLKGQSEGEFQIAVVSQTDQGLWFRVQPATHSLEFEGTVGTVAIGTERYNVDQIDNLRVTFTDWPNILREPRFIVDELGEERFQRYLTAHGTAESVILNGEELVQIHRSWPISTQLRVILGLIAAIAGILAGILGDALVPNVVYAIAKRGRKPNPRPRLIWALFYLSTLVFVVFGTIAAVAS